MTEERSTAIEFPCDFPIKVMGLQADDFDTLVVQIAHRHAGPLRSDAVSVRLFSTSRACASFSRCSHAAPT